jgi:hypothetical protein
MGILQRYIAATMDGFCTANTGLRVTLYKDINSEVDYLIGLLEQGTAAPPQKAQEYEQMNEA